MPYIKQEDRDRLKKGDVPKTPGEINYLITMLCLCYLKHKGESYQTHNDIMGALAGVQQEWYRRKVAPYEDKKIEENGDVV